MKDKQAASTEKLRVFSEEATKERQKWVDITGEEWYKSGIWSSMGPHVNPGSYITSYQAERVWDVGCENTFRFMKDALVVRDAEEDGKKK